MSSERRAQLQPILDELAVRGGFRGVLLVGPDGYYMMSGPTIASADAFSVAAIALHGSAESALGETPEERLLVSAEVGELRLVTRSVGFGAVLVALADRTLSASEHQDRVTHAAERVERAFAAT